MKIKKVPQKSQDWPLAAKRILVGRLSKAQAEQLLREKIMDEVAKKLTEAGLPVRF